MTLKDLHDNEKQAAHAILTVLNLARLDIPSAQRVLDALAEEWRGETAEEKP
jgi:hypothetical protein